MNAQDLMDFFNLGARASRGNYHLTLGELTTKLSFDSPDLRVTSDYGPPGIGRSYRSDYCDLAFGKGGRGYRFRKRFSRPLQKFDRPRAGRLQGRPIHDGQGHPAMDFRLRD